jgi:hypothetical protein
LTQCAVDLAPGQLRFGGCSERWLQVTTNLGQSKVQFEKSMVHGSNFPDQSLIFGAGKAGHTANGHQQFSLKEFKEV